MSSPGAGGPWSDGETCALIDVWGPMHLGRNRGSLHVAEWRQVCSAVNAHRAASARRFNRSLIQCQKRVYTLKDQYKKELAKRRPTPEWRHFAQLRAFLSGPVDGPPPGFAAKMPQKSVVKEEEDATGGGASGSVGRRTVPDIHDRWGGPAKMPVTSKRKKEEVDEEQVAGEGLSNVTESRECSPAKVVTKLAEVVTKLAEVYERVEMEKVIVEKGKMIMEWEKRAAKAEAENLGETDDN